MNTNTAALEVPAVAAWRVAGGSVIGRHHRRLDRPNQDGFAWARHDAALVAVVCDGCSAGRHSEVGAVLGARLWATALAARLAVGPDLADPAPWALARADVLEQLAALVGAMGGDRRAIVADHFLFTTVIAVVTGAQVAVHAIGDGVYGFDLDAPRELGPFADNAPPYLGYELLGGRAPTTAHEVRPASTIDAIIIGSDGAAALDPGATLDFAREPRFVRNPDLVRRHLAAANAEHLRWDAGRGAIERLGAPLGDDTTVVVLRRDP